MLRIGICDDEKMAAAILEQKVKQCLQENDMVAEIEVFLSGEELIESRKQFDILFLDIDMPGKDGIATGMEYRKWDKECKIVMETSRVERMCEVFYLEAYRFLVKPISEQELEEVFLSYQKRCIGGTKISLMENRQCVNIRQRDICYVQSYDSYTEFIVKDRILRSEKSLRILEDELDERLFFRIDKKYIVNLGYIGAYHNGIVKIGEMEFTVARRRKSAFETAYRLYDLEYR